MIPAYNEADNLPPAFALCARACRECAPRLSGQSKVANLRNIVAYLGEIWRIGQSMRAQPRPG